MSRMRCRAVVPRAVVEVGIRPIGRKSAVCLDHSPLHEVLCVDDIRRQLPGDAKEAVMQGNCFVHESASQGSLRGERVHVVEARLAHRAKAHPRQRGLPLRCDGVTAIGHEGDPSRPTLLQDGNYTIGLIRSSTASSDLPETSRPTTALSPGCCAAVLASRRYCCIRFFSAKLPAPCTLSRVWIDSGACWAAYPPIALERARSA